MTGLLEIQAEASARERGHINLLKTELVKMGTNTKTTQLSTEPDAGPWYVHTIYDSHRKRYPRLTQGGHVRDTIIHRNEHTMQLLGAAPSK